MSGYGYTSEQEEFIARHLPTRGHKWVAERIGKHHGSVWKWAAARGIRLGDLEGWVRTADVAAETGVNPGNIMRLAQRDRALRRLGKAKSGEALCTVVRQAWADAYTSGMRAEREGELARAAGFVTVDQASALWRVGRTTILRGLHGVGVLAELLAGATSVRGLRGAWLINPHDAGRIRSYLERDRALARSMVSTKSISIEAGVKQVYAADVGRRLGGTHILTGGRICCYVTHATARRMRERFRQHATEALS